MAAVIGETEFLDQLRAIRAQVDPAVLTTLREAHDAYDFGCAAHAEGLSCCVDWLLEDPAIEWPAPKSCTSIPCPPFEDVTITVQPWVPTLAQLRQAGAAIMQPDGSYYVERDGEVVHMPAAPTP